MNKRFKRFSAIAVSVLSLMSLSAVSMPAFAENEKPSLIIEDWDEYMKNLEEQEYQNRYGELCDEELFYTCMGAEVSFVDENGEPFENLEVKFIERVDGGNDKYKVIESWNTSDEPVKKILVDGMMTDKNSDMRKYSFIVDNIPEDYVCEDMEYLKAFMSLPKEEQPSEWIYVVSDVMSVHQTKIDSTKAGIFGVEQYYEKHQIELIPKDVYQQSDTYYALEGIYDSLVNPADKFTDYAQDKAAVECSLSGDANYDSEVTLSGDANCDDEVTISDSVLIMQTIVNPDEFKMTMQGRANADVVGDGDGVTLSDAFEIQEIALRNFAE